MGSPDLQRRFACIGLEQPKHAHNVGSALRADGVYGAKMVASCCTTVWSKSA